MERTKKKKEPEHKAHEAAGMMRWLLTYADMLTLLFALFVILYAMSKVQVVQILKVSQSLQKAFTKEVKEITPQEIKELVEKVEGKPPASHEVKVVDKHVLAMERLYQQFVQFIKSKRLERSMEVKKDERGLVVLLQTDNVLFDLGQADLRPQTKTILHRFSHLVRASGIDNRIRIEGHTDTIPLVGGEFKDNWGLSVARATSVLRFLTEKGLPPTQLEAAGLGEYHPLVPNSSDENRQKNRRVELIILTQKEEKATLKEELKLLETPPPVQVNPPGGGGTRGGGRTP